MRRRKRTISRTTSAFTCQQAYPTGNQHRPRRIGMKRPQLLFTASAVIGTLLAGTPAVAESDDAGVELVAGTGTPLRISLDKTVGVKRVGQVVTGTLIEPLYAYDRLILPIG